MPESPPSALTDVPIPAGASPALLDDVRDAAGVRGGRGQEPALLEDALAQLVDPHGVDEPLQPGAELVVAVAVVAFDAEDRLDGGEEVFTRRELFERLRRVRVGTEPAGHEHLEAGLDGAVGTRPVHRDHADVVEHRLAAVGRAAREVDLELAGEALRDRVAQEEILRRFRPRADVEHLVGARAGEVAAGDVADGVAAGLTAREPDRGQEAQHLADRLQLHEVELDVLAGGEVGPAARVRLGEVAEHLQLVGLDLAVRDLHPHHLVEAALALAVDTLVQAHHPEHVVVDLAGDEPASTVFEGAELLLDLGFEGLGTELEDVDCHTRGSYSGFSRNTSELVGNKSDRIC